MKYINSITALMIGGLLFTACSSKDKSAATTDASAAVVTEKAPIPVRVIKLAKSKISRTIDYTATILPFEEVNMAPSTPGRIEKIYVEVGDRVSKGQNLFLMDRTQLYQLKLQLSSLEKILPGLIPFSEREVRSSSSTISLRHSMMSQRLMWTSWKKILQ